MINMAWLSQIALDEMVRQHERPREERGDAPSVEAGAALRARVEELEARLKAEGAEESRRAQGRVEQVLSHIMCFRKSAPRQNCQLTVLITNSKH